MIDSNEIREAAALFEREGIVSRIAVDTYKMLADDSGNHPIPDIEDILLSILRTDKLLQGVVMQALEARAAQPEYA